MWLYKEQIGSEDILKYAENGAPKEARQSERLELIQGQTKEAVIIRQPFRAKSTHVYHEVCLSAHKYFTLSVKAAHRLISRQTLKNKKICNDCASPSVHDIVGAVLILLRLYLEVIVPLDVLSRDILRIGRDLLCRLDIVRTVRVAEMILARGVAGVGLGVGL
jgi:hypothetical protein